MQFSFLELTSFRTVGQPKYIPIYYLFNRQFSGQGTGLLVTLSAYRSPPTFPRTENVTTKLRKLQTELREEGYIAQPRVFLYVGYKNIYGRGDDTLFEVSGNPSDNWYSGPAFARVLPKRANSEIAEERLARNVDELTVPEILRRYLHPSRLSTFLNQTAMGDEVSKPEERRKLTWWRKLWRREKVMTNKSMWTPASQHVDRIDAKEVDPATNEIADPGLCEHRIAWPLPLGGGCDFR